MSFASDTRSFREKGEPSRGGKPPAAGTLGPPGSAGEKDRKIGHRRVNEEGEVSYKKIHSNQLIASIQLGIQYSVGAMTKYDERDLLMQDFMTVDINLFPKGGGHHTPSHTFSDFKFSTFAPLAFRYFLNLFGIRREDFLMSMCSELLRELSNPGASGSMFFLTPDDEFILKTIQHKEAEFLQKLLPGYYMNLNQNPHTLLPKFFGMFCYQCNQKNIRLTIMNNLLPTAIKMHLRFDLKGSTYKRKAGKRERAKRSPTYKDLDFMELLPEGLLLEPETYNALISTMRRDCRVLESFRIMDYSLLVGIHNLDLAAKEDGEEGISPTRQKALERVKERRQKQKLVAHSTAMESIQAQTEPIDEQEHLPPGGIPARNHKGERLLLYLGIIDILQSYRIRKKVEHTLKALIHDGDTVSVHRPGFYAHRFLDFMADKVFKKIPSPLKHSPSRKGKRDPSMKRVSIKGSLLSAVENPPSIVSIDSTGGAGNVSTSEGTSGEENGYPHHQTASSRRPDVVPGNALYDASGSSSSSHQPIVHAVVAAGPSYTSALSSSSQYYDSSVRGYHSVVSDGMHLAQQADHTKTDGSAIGLHSSSSPHRSSKPSNRHLRRAIGQPNSTDSLGSSVPEATSHRPPGFRGGSVGGTPSRLSAGTGSGWNTPTPNTWTEGTPSYTTSSLSGGSAPSRTMRFIASENVASGYKTQSYQETEM